MIDAQALKETNELIVKINEGIGGEADPRDVLTVAVLCELRKINDNLRRIQDTATINLSDIAQLLQRG